MEPTEEVLVEVMMTRRAFLKIAGALVLGALLGLDGGEEPP